MTAGRPRNVPPQPDVDIRQIIQEAQNRWLRPMEVCEILRNYKLHNFKLNPVPATTPASGNLFLFDRKALRYFRKDGHNWRKKKDGKTVREAHERLKAGSIDVLHCYYAHGEDNPNFQRRAYWMLDPAFEHIVLVHYREVTENNRSCILRNVLDSSGSERISNSTPVHPQHSQYAQTSTSSVSLATSMASPDTVEMPGTSHSPEPEEVESVDPDELEEAVAEVIGEQAGVQSSLLDQLADRSQVQGLHHQLGPEPWHSGSGNTNNLSGAGRQVSVPSFQTQEVFKPAFSDPRNLLHQGGPLRPPFPQNEAVSSISRQFADILDSPGPSYNNLSHQDLQASNSGDIPRWAHGILENGHANSGHGNGGGSAGKHGFGQSSWEDMLNTVTTPSTRNRLLQGEGLTSSLGQSPLGRDPSLTMGAPTSPKGKGIVDALSPKHLGREPQSALEADLRDVTEKKILKEAEERMQRNRWQPMSELSMVGAANQRMQSQSSSQRMIMPFGELDTLSALVRSGHVPPQDSGSSWASIQELPGVQNSYQYDKNALGQQHLQVSPPLQNSLASLDSPGLFSPTIEQILKDVRSEDPSNLDIMESYKKLDSFGRWMNGNDDITDIHPVPTSSGSLWDSGYPEVPQHMDESSILSPSLSEQFFNIIDFSPEWGSSTEETKVIISGLFLKTVNGADQRWCCMFGTVEVPAEVIGDGALRCKAPAQDSQSVPFYITCGDRQACSQVRYFEYRSPANLSLVPGSRSADSSLVVETKEDLLLKIRLSRMLLGHTSVLTNGRNDNKTQTFEENDNDVWKSLENMVHTEGKPLTEVKEELLEVILSHKLEEWLRVKSQMDDGRGPRVLDDRGQGVPHFVAALGYVWSIAQLFVADVPINFRDSSGWTALHWAAKFGREKMVVALIEAGAAAVLISDPTHRYPRGETAADLARTFGHGGIAAFLATKSLTERLSDLTLNDRVLYLNEIDKMSADMEGEQAVAQLARRTSIIRTVQQQEDREKLQTSLEAVRSSTQAAALIQSVFRQHSFRRRQEEVDLSNVDEYGLSPFEVLSFLAARKIQQAYRGHHQKKVQNLAATRIQQKYRGWKGRREFQTIRQRIIRIQAHVRGRIVRNHFKKIIWSVSIVEKVVLRWLRKRKGLRGFNPSRDLQQAVDDNEDLIKEGREKQKEAVEGDVAIVHSMARQKLDRDQYTRLVEEERRTSASKGELNELNEFMTSSGDYMDP